MSDIPMVYRSTDPGAPQLSGQPGAFAALMDAVLVDGYGSGGGAKPGLGWTRAFIGTNKRSFRNDPALYSGCYIRFDDANAQYVLVDAYEAMSSVDAGTLRFNPTSNAWAKSNAASSAARSWIIVGTARCVYVMIQYSTAANWVGQFFGDAHPIVATDLWNFVYTRSQAASGYNPTTSLGLNVTNYNSAIQRTADGISGAALVRAASMPFSNSGGWGAQGYPYPLHGVTGALLTRGFAREGDATNTPPRIWFPGLWVPEHNMTSVHAVGDVVDDIIPGVDLLAIRTAGSNADNRMYLDLTSPWIAG